MAKSKRFQNPYTKFVYKIFLVDKLNFNSSDYPKYAIYIGTVFMWLLFGFIGSVFIFTVGNFIIKPVFPSLFLELKSVFILLSTYITSRPIGVAYTVFVFYAVMNLSHDRMDENLNGTYRSVHTNRVFILFIFITITSGLFGIVDSRFLFVSMFSGGFFVRAVKVMCRDDMDSTTESKFYPEELWIVPVAGGYYASIAFVVAGGSVEVAAVGVAFSVCLALIYTAVRVKYYHDTTKTGTEFREGAMRYYKYDVYDFDTHEYVAKNQGSWYFGGMLPSVFSDDSDASRDSTGTQYSTNDSSYKRPSDFQREAQTRSTQSNSKPESTQSEVGESMDTNTEMNEFEQRLQPPDELTIAYRDYYLYINDKLEDDDKLKNPTEFNLFYFNLEHILVRKDAYLKMYARTEDQEAQEKLSTLLDRLNEFQESLEELIDLSEYEVEIPEVLFEKDSQVRLKPDKEIVKEYTKVYENTSDLPTPKKLGNTAISYKNVLRLKLEKLEEYSKTGNQNILKLVSVFNLYQEQYESHDEFSTSDVDLDNLMD